MKKARLIILSIMLITQTFFLYGQGFPGMQGGGNDPFSVMDNIFNKEEETPTPEGEYYVGRAVAANILTVYKPYTQNTALTRYLNNICQALAINSSMPKIYNGYYVMILDSQEFNAFATPGGHIFITKGLAEAAPSEDALAGIIAHELSHIMLHHGMKIINEMKLYSTLDSLAQQSAVIAGSGNEENQRNLAFRNSVSELLDILLKSGYSQAQEFEADDNAIELLASAGYDPLGLPEALGVLQRSRQQGGILSTHPAPSERISNALRRTGDMVSPNTQSVRKARFDKIMGKR